MSHDKAPREIEAERGAKEFEYFSNFVKNEFDTDLTSIFLSEESEENKINQLDKWWSSYKKTGR